jgi:ubiquinone/menaquinone biosynthesis C-methylase UbiE
MVDDKVQCMNVSRQYDVEYWDGDRRYGYGGYHYDGRWKPLAEQLIARYHLGSTSRILDVGCGKAHLLYELKQLLPAAHVQGIDSSWYGLKHAPEPIRPYLAFGRAQEPYPFGDQSFDLVLSLGCLHNLQIHELGRALKEIERVGKQKYVMVESYRNAQEQFNLQCWALTCYAFFSQDEWLWLYQHFGYTGDCEFIYFE